MTSKEALMLLEMRCRYFAQDDMEIEEIYEAREAIEKDLEMLEILKENYSKAIKRENHLRINDMDLVDARDVKVKEWLE